MNYFLTQDKLYLIVPYEEKDEVKKRGAKYDGDLKLWYLPPLKDPLEFSEYWAFLEKTFEDKEELKQLGAKFNSNIKKWYVPNNLDYDEFVKWWPENLKRFHLLDKYFIYDACSKTGQSSTYFAFDNNYDKYIVKIFNERLESENTQEADLSFQKEMVALQKLARKNHKNIISIEDYGLIEETNQHYHISKFQDYDLETFINSPVETITKKILEDLNYDENDDDYQETFNEVNEIFISDWHETVDDIMLPILDALVFCVENNIYHRDVKPGNILIGFETLEVDNLDEEELQNIIDNAKEDEIFNIIPKLCDFGISKSNIENILNNTKTKVYYLSEPFRPPVSNSKEISFQNTWDIYGWSATTIALINKTVPENDKELRNLLKTNQMKKFDKNFVNLLKLSIHKTPKERPQDIKEFKSQVLTFFKD